jgi:hypothetical protein
MHIDFWHLSQIFPNIAIDDLEKYRRNSEGFKIYEPKIEEGTHGKYKANSIPWDIMSTYLMRCSYHRSYKVDFSSSADINTQLSSFYMDTDEFNHSAWTRENITKMAHYMSKEPLLLPSFIIENSLNILSQLMGYESFRRTVEIEGRRGKESDFFDRIFIQFLGLRHLSIFCAFLEELIKEGVNVEAIPIRSNYYRCTDFDCLFGSYLDDEWYDEWHHSKKQNHSERNEYHKEKQYDFDMKSFFEFRSVTEFLSRVRYCIENNFSSVSTIGHFHNWEMPDPTTIDFSNKNYVEFFEKNFYEKVKNSISTIAYQNYFSGEKPNCTYFLPYERENENKEKGEKVKVIPYLKQLNALLTEKDKNTKMEIAILKKVYQYLANKKIEHQKQFGVLEEIISLLPIIEKMESTGDYFTEEEINYIELRKEDFPYQKEESEKELRLSLAIKEQMEKYQQEIGQLKQELEYQKYQNSKLEEKIQEYLKNGGSIPLDSLSSKEDVEYAKQVLAKIACTNFLEKARRVAFSMLLYGVSATALLTFTNKKLKEINPNVSFKVSKESAFSHANIPEGKHPLTDWLEKENLFPSQEPILEEPKIEEMPFLFGDYEVSATIPYYETIYDSNPVGYTQASGLIISYYALEQTETQLTKVATFKTQEELNAFLMINKDRNLIWKAGYYIGNEVDELKAMINSGFEIPHTYISFFIEYNVQKELEGEKVIIKK